MASPQKRLKISPPIGPVLHSSRLPVRNGTTLPTMTATTIKGTLYPSPVRAKPVSSSRHSPYGERTVAPKTNGSSVDITIGKLNLRATAGFRRAGGPRLSQSPARRSSFFEPSVPIRLESESPQSVEDDSEDTPRVLSKGKGPAERIPETKDAEDLTQRIGAENEALSKLVKARVNALRMEVEDLREEVQKEQARVERDARGVPGESDVEAMINRLLAANDSSHKVLPRLEPATDPGIPSARPLTVADPLPQLSAFHCLTFTSTSTTTITPEPTSTSAPTSAPTPELTLTQRHTTHGYSANRLLFFTLAFTVTASSWTVSNLTYDISPWAHRELRPPLNLAAHSSDINTILYALSSYTTLAQKRAAVFSHLSQTFPHLLPVLVPRRAPTPSRRDIVPWLGTALLRFRKRAARGGVELVVSWDITIGVGGEAESHVQADVRVPMQWSEVDEMDAFSKVGEVFGLLVRERGVFEATRCIVGLIFQ